MSVPQAGVVVLIREVGRGQPLSFDRKEEAISFDAERVDRSQDVVVGMHPGCGQFS